MRSEGPIIAFQVKNEKDASTFYLFHSSSALPAPMLVFV